eukprot:794679_1
MHHLKPLNVLFPRIGGGLSMARVIVMESLFLICIATHFTIYAEIMYMRNITALYFIGFRCLKPIHTQFEQYHIILLALDSNHTASDQMARLEDDTKLLMLRKIIGQLKD